MCESLARSVKSRCARGIVQHFAVTSGLLYISLALAAVEHFEKQSVAARFRRFDTAQRRQFPKRLTSENAALRDDSVDVGLHVAGV